MTKVGFLGAGLIARAHARGLAPVLSAEIHACYDTDADRGQRFAADFDCNAALSAAEVIDSCDAIYICTWTSEHAALVDQVARANKAVFCEKPLAVDLPTAQHMERTVREAGVVNQVGLILRHSPAFRWLRSEIQSGRHGSPMSLIFRDDQYLPTQGLYGSTWRSDVTRAGAGALLEHSIHDLDLIRWILGPIESVSCQTHFHHGLEGIEDQATLLLKTQSGAHVVLVSVWHDVLSRPSQRRLELFNTDALLTIDGDWNGPVTWERADGSTGSLSGSELAGHASDSDGRGVNPDAAFIEAVEAGGPAYPGFEIALDAHRLVDAAYRSAADGGVLVDIH